MKNFLYFLISLNEETKSQIRSRENKLKRKFMGLSICYILCVGPFYLMNWFQVSENVHVVCYSFYQLQYALNFVIYALFEPDYRKAYVGFLKEALPWMFRRSSKNCPDESCCRQRVGSCPASSLHHVRRKPQKEIKRSDSCPVRVAVAKIRLKTQMKAIDEHDNI